MTRFSSSALGRAGLLLGMLVALALAFAAMANATHAVDHAEGERHTHAALTTAADDDHGDSAWSAAFGDPSDAGSNKSGQAHHHHLDPGAGIAVGTAVVAPTERMRDHRQPMADARLADAKVEGLQRPPRVGITTA